MIEMEIKTERLTLKSVTPKIIHALFERKSKAEIMAFFECSEAGYDRLKFMNEKGMETDRISLSYFLILNNESGKVIGECGFHTWNKLHHRAELFYNLKHDADKRKGIISEALSRVLHFGFEELGLHRIEALTAKDNIASIKTLEHFGFLKEGTMREDYVVDGKNVDSECYSLLKWEWQQANQK